MASPTVASLLVQVTALEAKVAELEKAAADHWKLRDEIAARNTSARLGELETYVAENRALIDELNESDEASGWKAWRESKKAEDAKKGAR